ncbi:hypothetical protein KBC89_01090 [Candidatus Woesebacteria bacterium]|nr:hypothetical protein [Candidatus Woesebacteria bacterium]
MQRGVITIQPNLVQILQSHTAEIAEHHPHTWEKLSDAATQSSESTSLELNKEEVEMILDLLPTPSNEETTELKLARTTILSLLQSMA